MTKKQATRNMILGLLLIGVMIIGAFAALGGTHLIQSLPR
jgi:hypothetical protein